VALNIRPGVWQLTKEWRRQGVIILKEGSVSGLIFGQTCEAMVRVGMCFRDDEGVKRYLLWIEMQRERGRKDVRFLNREI
jgi:hypothetical protein